MSLLISTRMASLNSDHRVATCLRKARQAAEREDLSRIGREFERLQEYSAELATPELNNPELLLFLGAGSDRARSAVEQALVAADVGKGALQRLRLPELLDHPSSSRTRQANYVEGENLHADRSDIDTSEALRVKMQHYANVAPSPIKWNADTFAINALPTQQIDWPDCTDLSRSVVALKAALQQQIDTLSSSEISIGSLRHLKTNLDESRLSVSQRISGLIEDVASIEDSVRQTVEAVLESLQPELSERSSRIRTALSTPSTPLPAQEIDDAIRQSNDLLQQKAISIASSIGALEVTAPYLSSDAQLALETQVRNLVLHFRPEELKKVVQDTEIKTEEPRRTRLKIREAATRVLAALDRAGEISLSPDSLGLIDQAVADGDALRGEELVTAAVLRSEAPKSADIADMHGNAVADFPSLFPTAPSAFPALVADTTGFVPRDRFTASDPHLPTQSDELVQFLRDRSLREIRRDSIAGAIDNALDILLLSSRATSGGEFWRDTGLIILSAMPTVAAHSDGWGLPASEVLNESLRAQDSDTLPNYLKELSLQPAFDDAISERFVHTEIRNSVDRLASSLVQAIGSDRSYLLEGIATAIGCGAAYGDRETCRELILALCRVAGVPSAITDSVGKLLQNDQAGIRLVDRKRAPEWLSESISAYHAALSERSKLPVRAPGKGGTLQLRVPVSVSRNGGFGYLAGSDEIEVALLLSNLQSRPLSSVEIALPRSRNPWLVKDVVCSAGALAPNSRNLLRFRATLKTELTGNASFELGWQGRYREPGFKETRFEDNRIESISFVQATSLALAGYEGAGGKPLILEGEALRLSSGSVRRALSDILSGLANKGIAALVIGRRRRGKTSILQTIAQQSDVRASYAVISDAWEDVPSVSLDQTLHHLGVVFDRAARTIGIHIDSLAERLSDNPSAGWTTIQNWLDDLATQLPAPKRLLLLIDEFQKWLTLLDQVSRTRVLNVLRGLFNRPEGGKLSISIVLSGLTNIREFIKSSADFQNAFKILSIEASNLSETEILIRSNPTVEFDARAVIRIRELSGGNPFLINLFCNDIVAHLREQNRAYCLPEDVEVVVKAQLEDRDNSRVWSFLQYLLKEDEEDHASDIQELPALIALAHTGLIKGSGRKSIGINEIVAELAANETACDPGTLEKHLGSAVQNELLIQRGSRYAFANGWLAEWLSVNDSPLPIVPKEDKDLVLGRFKLGTLITQGGQASAFEGQDTRASNRAVVVKIYPRSQAAGGPSSTVIQEAKMLHSIEHTAVVRCVEFGPDPSKGDVIVLERIQGDTVRKLLEDRPKYASALIGSEGNLQIQVKFIEQIAAALVLLCYKSRYLWVDFPGRLEPLWLTWAHEAPAAELVRSVAAI